MFCVRFLGVTDDPRAVDPARYARAAAYLELNAVARGCSNITHDGNAAVGGRPRPGRGEDATAGARARSGSACSREDSVLESHLSTPELVVFYYFP